MFSERSTEDSAPGRAGTGHNAGMRALPLALVAAAACGAKVDGGTVDGAPPADVSPPPGDAPADTRACAGGDAAMTAPDGSCFVLFTTPTPYDQAQAGCAALQAHLAKLDTSALDQAAEVFVGTNDTFIGASDRASEGTFLWDDGSPVAFSNFALSEPNNSGGGGYEEDCLLIAGARVTKQWDDRPCDPAALPNAGLYAYLCQF